ncbi:MAG: GTPase [Acutalibacteraceae bacterium]|nr:GTPase [Acutalibacteraceae bacterium]
MDIPVYLFTGFLESGKTTFIQGTLEDERFNRGEKTLIMLCEEGVEEYDIKKMPGQNIFIETFDDIEDVTPEGLTALQKKLKIERVIIELNGMWLTTDLFARLPENWVIYQEMCFLDATTFLSYNANMRQLVVDKLQQPEIVVFNRFTEDMDKMEFHKIVRGVSRRCDICYEFSEDRVEYDDIEDPLPFDINADVIEIDDRDFAIWYRDMMEELQKYQGKTVKFKGLIARDRKIPDDELAIGRHIMTCCVEDIQYGGVVCKLKNATDYKTHDWAIIKGKINLEKNKLYRSIGPVITIEEIERCEPLEDSVATFY